MRACNNLPQPNPYIFGFWGLRKIVACSQSSSQCLLVSTVFGMVSSLHPTSFLMIFTLVYSRVRECQQVSSMQAYSCILRVCASSSVDRSWIYTHSVNGRGLETYCVALYCICLLVSLTTLLYVITSLRQQPLEGSHVAGIIEGVFVHKTFTTVGGEATVANVIGQSSPVGKTLLVEYENEVAVDQQVNNMLFCATHNPLTNHLHNYISLVNNRKRLRP